MGAARWVGTGGNVAGWSGGSTGNFLVFYLGVGCTNMFIVEI